MWRWIIDNAEALKVIISFLATVLIAVVGLWVTQKYNEHQLEITRLNNEKQWEITRLKEISNLIPRLGSPNGDESKFSAIALGLYGKEAVPALVALIEDDRPHVWDAILISLEIIGDDAIQPLTTIFEDKRRSERQRGLALYHLGKLNAASAFEYAKDALAGQNLQIRYDAVWAMYFMRKPECIVLLKEALEKEKDVPTRLAMAQALFETADSYHDPEQAGENLIKRELAREIVSQAMKNVQDFRKDQRDWLDWPTIIKVSDRLKNTYPADPEIDAGYKFLYKASEERNVARRKSLGSVSDR